MPACQSDSGIRDSLGREEVGDTKIYRQKAYREHLREIACREDNSEIRKSPHNEENKGLAKRSVWKKWKDNELRAY